MLVAAILTLCAAVVVAGLGAWSLTRRPAEDFVGYVLRAVAPTQLAAGVMLGAGGVVALSAVRPMSLIVLVVCIIGAVGTVAAGCWQGAKIVARENARLAAAQNPGGGCGSACGSCTLSCDR